MKARIPATIVTGFLGAGKTTVVSYLLSQPHGKRIALIVNEFGDVGVDGSLLAACGVENGGDVGVEGSSPSGCGVESCREDDIIELANGCLCCTVADEFQPAMEKLLDRENPPDHIIIETSGLALPKPLIKAFDWPGIRSRVTVDGVVVVVDGPAAAAGKFESTAEERARPDHDNPLEEVFTDQLACADLVLLNKTDLLGKEGAARLAAELQGRLRPGVKAVATKRGKVDVRLLLGLGAAAEDDLESRPSLHDSGPEHDHDDFESFAVTIPPTDDLQAVLARVAETLRVNDILRLKGFLAVSGKQARHVVQAVGARVTSYYDRPWRAEEDRTGRLVVIGLKGMDRAAIEAGLAT